MSRISYINIKQGMRIHNVLVIIIRSITLNYIKKGPLKSRHCNKTYANTTYSNHNLERHNDIVKICIGMQQLTSQLICTNQPLILHLA